MYDERYHIFLTHFLRSIHDVRRVVACSHFSFHADFPTSIFFSLGLHNKGHYSFSPLFLSHTLKKTFSSLFWYGP
jgi:hypothetical protein